MLYFASAEHRGGEIGWVLHPGHSGRRYATASHGLVHLAFDLPHPGAPGAHTSFRAVDQYR
ncbi:MAG: hypothetical protein M0Z87_05845 [Actinomycetota bacterium]|nr:hypothetical protein [Actinomycetota bacterium]